MTLFRDKFRIESTRLADWDYASPGAYFITICTKDCACLFGDVVSGKMILNDLGKIIHDEWLKSFEIRSELNPDVFCVMPNHIHGIVFIKSNLTVETHRDVHTPNRNFSVETHGRASLQVDGKFESSPNHASLQRDKNIESDPGHAATANQNHPEQNANGDANLSTNTYGDLRTPNRNFSVETHGRASLQMDGKFESDPNHASLKMDKNIESDPGRVSRRRESNMPLRKPRSIGSFVAGFKSASTSKINRFRNSARRPVWQPRYHDHIIRNNDALAKIRQYILDNPANWQEEEYFVPSGRL